MMEIISKQNGGSETFYVCEEDNEDLVFPCKENKRSYVLAKINKEFYDSIDVEKLRKQGLKIKVYKPGEEIEYYNDLLMTDDYSYPDKSVGVSTLFVEDVLDEYEKTDDYHLFGVDLIWCRSDLLFETLSDLEN